MFSGYRVGRLIHNIQSASNSHDHGESGGCKRLPGEAPNADLLQPARENSMLLLLFHLAQTRAQAHVEVLRRLRRGPRIEHIHSRAETLELLLTGATRSHVRLYLVTWS